jgi:hypothetical protein
MRRHSEEQKESLVERMILQIRETSFAGAAKSWLSLP